MRRYIKQARDEGLDWQTSLIMDVQTEIKQIISQAVLLGWTWAVVNAKILEAVKDTDELTDSLKERARASLLVFATVQYRTLVNALRGIDLSVLDKVSEYDRNPSQKLETELKTQAEYIETAQPLREFSQDYMKKVRDAFDKLAKSDAKDDYGSNVSLRNIAEMTVRYEDKLKEIDKLKADGVNLVWISAHANCSKRCEAAQGKLYSLDGTSGTIDGVSYRPLEEVTEVYVTTKSGKTYRNGIIYGFNCRHYLIPYKKGTKPIEVSAELVEKQRRINNTQRAMERGVRYYRDKALTAPTKEQRSKSRKQAKAAYSRYIAYSEKNNVAYYPSRVSTW